MNKLNLNISVEEPNWKQALTDIERVSETVFEKTVDYVRRHEEIDFLETTKPLGVNLALSNDEEVHRLNAEFRHMDKPTNVLSFANIDDPGFEDSLPLCAEIELGDIIIALETMQREAKEKGISLHDHYCHLLTHGILHLLGFDHMEDDEAEYMESFEIEILAGLNIKNPYEE